MKKQLLIALGVVGVIVVVAVIFKGKRTDIEAKPLSSGTSNQFYQQALALRKNQDLLGAREAYKQILVEHPDVDNIENVQKELEDLNLEVIYSNTPTPKTVVHEVQAGDTLGKLAKQYDTTVELIKKRNNLRSDVIRLGQKISIWTGKFNIFVDKSQNVLILKEENDIIKTYRVSTGQNNTTPVGKFKIINKLVDPVWFNSGVVVPPESPQNVLGTRWLGFDLPGYGIHGTVDPETIGQQVTAGCVRMTNSDVEQLYELVTAGTEVTIVD